ncbi:MAG: hypothetical protein OXG98_18855 [Gemmatimonadetes bacterium]|nr:hypothetical protein [Gemmatimonadota bacterium]
MKGRTVHDNHDAQGESSHHPEELSDAWDRIEVAQENLCSLSQEMDKFLYNFIRSMIKGYDNVRKNRTIQLRHPKDCYVVGRPRVLVAQIVENLRSALDYMVVNLSKLNQPDVNEKIPQFVIAENIANFESRAKNRLRFLTREQKSFIKKLQPYHGNLYLEILGAVVNVGKHRRLVKIQNNTSFALYYADKSSESKYPGHFKYQLQETDIYAKPIEDQMILLMDKYNCMKTLDGMIDHTAEILRLSSCYFEGRNQYFSIVWE